MPHTRNKKRPEGTVDRDEAEEILSEALHLHQQREDSVRVADLLDAAGSVGVGKEDLLEAVRQVEEKRNAKEGLSLAVRIPLAAIEVGVVLAGNVALYTLAIYLLNSPSDWGHRLGLAMFLVLLGLDVAAGCVCKKILFGKKG